LIAFVSGGVGKARLSAFPKSLSIDLTAFP
jgi:hypothetical protein